MATHSGMESRTPMEEERPGADVDHARERQLTEGGIQQLEQKIRQHNQSLDKTVRKIDLAVLQFGTSVQTVELNSVKDNMLYLQDEYVAKLKEFHEMLERNASDISDREMAALERVEETVKQKVSLVISKIDWCLTGGRRSASIDEEQSVKSSASKTSRTSAATEKRAKLEAARVELEFAKRQLALQKRQAEAEAEHKLLQLEKNVAVADAEYRVYAEEEQEDFRPTYDPVLEQTRAKRTLNYVERNIKTEVHKEPFVPDNPEMPRPVDQHTVGIAAEFSKYLVRKELLMTRFMHFNDQPESFQMWKANFKSLISELNVS